MQNLWLIVYSIICLAIVKYIIYKMRVRSRIKRSSHPIKQARDLMNKMKNYEKRIEHFPQSIKAQIARNECKSKSHLIEYVAVLVAALELSECKDLFNRALIEASQLELGNSESVHAQYLQEKMKSNNIVKYDRLM